MIDELLTRHAPDADDMEDISRELRGSVLAGARLDTGHEPLSPRRQVAAWLVPTGLALAAAVAATVLVVSPGTLRGDSGPATGSSPAAPLDNRTPLEQLTDVTADRSDRPLAAGQVRRIQWRIVTSEPETSGDIPDYWQTLWVQWDGATYRSYTPQRSVPLESARHALELGLPPFADLEFDGPDRGELTFSSSGLISPRLAADLPTEPQALTVAVDRLVRDRVSLDMPDPAQEDQAYRDESASALMGIIVLDTAPHEVTAAAIGSLVELGVARVRQGARPDTVDLVIARPEAEDQMISTLSFSSVTGRLLSKNSRYVESDGQAMTRDMFIQHSEIVDAVPDVVIDRAKAGSDPGQQRASK